MVSKESQLIRFPNLDFTKYNEFLEIPISDQLEEIIKIHPNVKDFNTCVIGTEAAEGYGHDYKIWLFNSNIYTRATIEGALYSDARITNVSSFTVTDKLIGHILIEAHGTLDHVINEKTTVKYIDSPTKNIFKMETRNRSVFYSTICFSDTPDFIGWYPNNGAIREWIKIIKKHFKLPDRICNGEIINPIDPPTGGQTDNSSCSNTGQFGGGGTPLKDIKLFLYANNVTKGTIKLSKPQVEVGTFATDWRPNPSDYVERNSPAYKEVKGLAIQHNKEQNKKYIEVQATDGTVYGVDLWGGDAKKLLEQQQAEIEELKKLVQTLETKINV